MPLLKKAGVVSLSAISEFHAAKAFNKSNPKVKFWGFSSNFTKKLGYKVERNIPATKLAISRLEIDALDPDIMAELGPTRRIIKLTHFYQVIESQVGGRFLAYIEDDNDVVWTVLTYWVDGDGWHVDTNSVGNPCRRLRLQGDQVISQV